MSDTQTLEKKKSEPLFSKKNKKLISNPLNDDNPITVQVLGICFALAITVKLEPAIVMSLSVLFVLGAGWWGWKASNEEHQGKAQRA